MVKQGKILAKSLRDGADLTSSVVAFLAIDECVTNMEQILKHEWTSDSPVDLGNYWENVGGTIFKILEEVSSSDLTMLKFHKITYLTK